MYRILALHIFFILISPVLMGQSGVPGYAGIIKPAESGERIILNTDRSLYSVGERIYFKADYQFVGEISEMDWSSVLYVELIRWNGKKIAQGKYPLTKTGVSGSIAIPRQMNTGNYYLRAYTKWMRNYSPNAYAVTSLKILNPFDSETDGGPSESNKLESIEEFAQIESMEGIALSSSKNKYKQREVAELKLSFKEIRFQDKEVIISISKVGSIDTSFHILTPNKTEEHAGNHIEYLPEIRGISVSGNLLNKKTGEPLADVDVKLSAPESGVYFSAYKSNEQGKFLFSLPLIYGKRDFYITAYASDSVETEVLIDNDFCNNPVRLPYIPFELTEAEQVLGRELALNMQITERFSSDTLKSDQSQLTDMQTVFYGHPEQVIHAKDFIELPNLEEFFIELVPGINVAYNKRKPYLRLVKPARFYSNSPLILMDNIPVANDAALLRTEASKIERVEVIAQAFAKADQLYYGLISIYSKNNDMAGMELSESGLFFNYNLYSNYSESEQSERQVNGDERIPDRRNILLWHSGLNLSSGKETISFSTSDNTGEYIVFARTIGSQGEPVIYGTCTFRVE